jgi:hypothetical protein
MGVDACADGCGWVWMGVDGCVDVQHWVRIVPDRCLWMSKFGCRCVKMDMDVVDVYGCVYMHMYAGVRK